MNFDRNTVIGFILLAVLFFGFFYYTNKQKAALDKQTAIEQAKKDSIAKLSPQKINPATQKDSGAVATNAIDSNGRFSVAMQGSEQLTTVENGLIKVVFTNKGGQPKYVELKRFKGPDSNNVRLAGTSFDKIDYSLQDNSKTDSITSLFFSGGQVSKNG